ncbi:hypothetical protein EON62_06250, partial [archaeon]
MLHLGRVHSSLAAFHLLTGSILADINNLAAVPAGAVDNFISSPAIAADGSAMYLHSTNGTLWRVNIEFNTTAVNMSFAWACDYTLHSDPYCDDIPVLMKTGVSNRTTSGVPFVTGGFYQPTTAAQRDELKSELQTLYATKHAAAHGSLQAAKGVAATLSINQLARALDYETVASITTPSGYRLLGPHGAPVDLAAAQRVGYTGTIPFATPALAPDNVTVIMAQYAPMGGDSGLFSIEAASGVQNWMFSQVVAKDGNVLKFGRSRSSPAIDANGYVYVGTDSDTGSTT